MDEFIFMCFMVMAGVLAFLYTFGLVDFAYELHAGELVALWIAGFVGVAYFVEIADFLFSDKDDRR